MVSREPLHPDDPEAISGYRLVERLGEGGMGVVYLAHGPDGRKVAVKVIRAHLSMHEDFRARFRAEVETASKVARFCTAPILDADTGADPPYIVTEYIDGPTLGAVVDEHGPLPGPQLHALGVGVASALGAIHHAGVVHRDLKPSNVLLSRFGPQVIDFGIARAIDAVTAITQPGRMMGSPSYMAPEQFRSDKLTQKVDIFAWGSLMIFAGTGRQPFGASTDAVFYQVLYGEPDLRGLDPQIAELVGWSLRKEADQRPTAQQLLDALVRSGEPASASAWPPDESAEADQLAAVTGDTTFFRGRRATDRPSSSGDYPQFTGTGEQSAERMAIPVEVLTGAARPTSGGRGYLPPPPAPEQRRPSYQPDPPAAPPESATTSGERDQPGTGSRAARRHTAAHGGSSRHAPRRRPILLWIAVGILGVLVGAGGSYGAVSYLDYHSARSGSIVVLDRYLADIRDNKLSGAYDLLCGDIRDSVSREQFTGDVANTVGIKTYTIDGSVPYTTKPPFKVRARIIERDGNVQNSLFDIKTVNSGGRTQYRVCQVHAAP